jgi:hypothetical protein
MVHNQFGVAKLKKVANSLAVHECTLEEGSCMYMSHAPDFVLALVRGDLHRASE